ncbi:hypothetical protein XBO1_710022 [Xenorhabdus bovienii str. oregonense]|uniref:Uncharacterized protein n=1 Tax=Xenorhabdus bovienii str. oregonense TaxID=1398202 RepID=A0A077PDZ5_XENBV|nr:hypothetical protein [Xenorhabdus bovienii]CDH07941.1 hypothetical protein XBO1_710022 [Xenorhabdus bovienii str. oregonense]
MARTKVISISEAAKVVADALVLPLQNPSQPDKPEKTSVARQHGSNLLYYVEFKIGNNLILIEK